MKSEHSIYINFDMNIVAIPKYISNDKISLIVVIKGPEATAGSTLNLLRIKGITVPAIVPIISVATKEEPTTNPSVKLPCHT